MDEALAVDEDERCLVLVDYDNAFPPGRPFTDAEVGVDVARWLMELARLYPVVGHFDVRLYGGWYDDTDLSRRGSEVAQIVRSMPSFPLRTSEGRIVRGEISLAVVPMLARNRSPLLGTYRRRGSLPRIQLSKAPYPDSCAQPDSHCPAHILKSFTRNPRRECPVQSCTLVSTDAFVLHEQKMVDTMLAADILTAGRDPDPYSIVVVVSGDSDFLPPLIVAGADTDSKYIQLLPRSNESSGYANAVLSSVGVEVVEVYA